MSPFSNHLYACCIYIAGGSLVVLNDHLERNAGVFSAAEYDLIFSFFHRNLSSFYERKNNHTYYPHITYAWTDLITQVNLDPAKGICKLHIYTTVWLCMYNCILHWVQSRAQQARFLLSKYSKVTLTVNLQAEYR